MYLLLYVHVCVTRTGWKTRPRPKTVILPIKKSNQIKSLSLLLLLLLVRRQRKRARADATGAGGWVAIVARQTLAAVRSRGVALAVLETHDIHPW